MQRGINTTDKGTIYTMGRGFNIPWIGGSIYHGKGGENTIGIGPIYHG